MAIGVIVNTNNAVWVLDKEYAEKVCWKKLMSITEEKINKFCREENISHSFCQWNKAENLNKN